MKRIIFLTIGFLYVLASYSQERFVGINNSVMYYTLNTSIEDQNIWKLNYESSSLNFDTYALSFSYSKINNRISQEVLLMPLNLNISDYSLSYINVNDEKESYNGGERMQFRSSLDYKISYTFVDESRKVLPIVGVGALLFYQREIFSPLLNDKYERRFNYIGLYLYANFGLIFNVSDRISLSIQAPFMLHELNLLWNIVEKPSLPERLRSNTKFKTQSFPSRYHVSIGLNFKIVKNK